MIEKHVDADGVVHEPALADGLAHDRCRGCGYRWPCPVVRQLPEPLLEGGDVVLDLVDLGWSIYRRLPPGADYVPPGGLVVEVRYPDDPNEPASYRVLSFRAGRPEFDDFAPGDFDPLLSSPPNSASIRSAVRKLAELVGRSRGTFTPHEYEWLRVAAALAGTVA